ncbi:MAG: LamG domain-containing protein [Candidatus Bipolaricaulota bacterium]|nr:LamG domain-containing protein [Candidatus Bipolaricaulota bacterium]
MDDFVEVPDGAGTLSHGNPTSNFTIDAWVKVNPGDASGVRPIVDKRFDFPDSQNPNVHTRGYAFYLFNGQLGFQIADDIAGLSQICDGGPPFTANCTNYVSTGPNIADGQWHHVAVTVQRTGTPEIRLYVDGNVVLTRGARTGNANSSIPLLIGAGYPIVISKPFFKGAIDEVEIFNRALDQSEIQAIFKAGPAGKCKKSVLGNEPLQCTPPQVTTVLQAGQNDNFNPNPDTPAASPTPAFVTAVGNPPLAGFDSTSPNHHFLHSFTGLPPGITSAQLEIRLKPLSDDNPENDALNLWSVPSTGPITVLESHFLGSGNAQPGLLTQAWNTANFPNGHVFLLNLGPAVVSSMNANGALHIQVQDDTSVDYVILRLCARPEGQAEICVFKFNDLNGNGIHEPNPPNNEPLLPGWTFNVSPPPPSSVTTGPQGGICFGVSAPGTYTISEVPQSGWTPTTSTSQTVTVQPGQLVNVFFGNKKEEAKCDLAIRKTVTPSPVGVQVTITLTVPTGQTCAPGTVVVQDLQPTGMTFVGLPGSLSVMPATGWNCAATTPTNLSCTNTVPLTGPYTATFSFPANVQPGIPIENCATATVSGQLISRSCVPVQIAPPPGRCDLQIRKSVSPNPVLSGQQVTITLTVQNVGNAPCPPGPFPGTIVRDNKPAGIGSFTLTSATAPAGWQCGLEMPAGNLTCATPNPLPPGYTATFTFTASVTAPPGSTIQNCATVTNPNDTNPTNNQSCVTISVIGIPPPPIDLTLAKLLDGVLRPEAEVTYVLRVTNVGGAATRAPIRVTDPLPPQLRFVSATGAGWSCSVSGQNVICTSTGSIAPNQSSTILLRVRVVAAPGTQITNCATVETEGDANPANNRGCHTGTVQR